VIEGLKPYPKMKDSGVEWLKQIPEHWDVPRMKTMLIERVQKGYPHEPLLTATQSRGVIRKDEYENRTVEALKDLHLLNLVEEGDFVISLRSFQGGIECAHNRGIISPAYTVLYPRNVETREFLAHLFKSRPFIENLRLHVTGIREGQNIDYVKLSRSRLPMPPALERDTIVQFLDYADRKIRQYVRDKQKLIQLLEEQKRSFAIQAILHGVGSISHIEHPGISWLGKVPGHWDIVQIGRFARVGNGSTPSRGTITYWKNGHFPWLNSSTVRSGNIMRADQFVTDDALRECHLPVLRPGSVLIAITGQGKTRGTAAVLEIEATINQHLAYVTAIEPDRVLPEYLTAFLQIAYPELRRISDDGGTKGALTCEQIKKFFVALPPLSEQVRIVKMLKGVDARTDQLIELARGQIDSIRQYSRRLVSDTVTGKLDVRNAAVTLSDEVDEQLFEESDVQGEDGEHVAEEAELEEVEA
jgi:type I restriction enzyme, S subunit